LTSKRITDSCQEWDETDCNATGPQNGGNSRGSNPSQVGGDKIQTKPKRNRGKRRSRPLEKRHEKGKENGLGSNKRSAKQSKRGEKGFVCWGGGKRDWSRVCWGGWVGKEEPTRFFPPWRGNWDCTNGGRRGTRERRVQSGEKKAFRRIISGKRSGTSVPILNENPQNP